MKVIIKTILLQLLCQLTLTAQTDSITILTAGEFIRLVKLYHPVAQQAALKVDLANAAALSAGGAFDPVLQMENSRKTLDGKNYYFYNNPELKIQTAAGIIIKTGIERQGYDQSFFE